MNFTIAAIVLAWIAITLLALVVSGLVRHVYALTAAVAGQREAREEQVHERPSALEIGAAAPSIDGAEGVGAGKPALLLFVDAACGTCERVLVSFAALAMQHSEDAAFVVLFSGRPSTFESPPVQVLAHMARTFQRYSVPMTPYAVGVSPDGRIAAAQGIAFDPMLDDLLERTLKTRKVA
jgi:hypothetical protein